MLLDSRKRIFVHIPKNAGMTIRHSTFLKDRILVNNAGTHKSKQYTQELLETMNAIGDHHGIEHARWRDLNEDYRQQYRAFAVIRNPWDRVVSRYFFAKKVIEVEKKVDPSYADVSSFEAFLEERHQWGSQKFMWHRAVRGWFPALDHVTDDAGIVRCDIIRFENLNEDLIQYFNIPMMSRARNVTALNKGTYMDVYNDKTRQIVADWYARDIDCFGYDFDTGPTKNYWGI
tara:strand:+ start:996 stop:1688 length:693 start_codon:yes stop_codon:yes gene_type:complete